MRREGVCLRGPMLRHPLLPSASYKVGLVLNKVYLGHWNGKKGDREGQEKRGEKGRGRPGYRKRGVRGKDNERERKRPNREDRGAWKKAQTIPLFYSNPVLNRAVAR